MIIKSVLFILFFIIGLMIGSLIVILLTNRSNKYRVKHKIPKNKKKTDSSNKVKERFTDDNTSISDMELENIPEKEKERMIEEKRKEQTKAYNYTDKEE